MLKLRKRIILAINLILFAWLGYIILYETNDSDFAGLFFIITIGLILFFNTYAITIYTHFKMIEKEHWGIEALFILALFSPLMFIYIFL